MRKPETLSTAVSRGASGARTVCDMKSKSGVYVDAERVTEPRPLRDGDVIELGNVTLVFLANAEA